MKHNTPWEECKFCDACFGVIRFPHSTKLFNKVLIFVDKKRSFEKEFKVFLTAKKHSSRSIFSDFINSRKDHERACHLSKEWVWTLEGKPVLGPTGDTQSTLYKMQHSQQFFATLENSDFGFEIDVSYSRLVSFYGLMSNWGRMVSAIVMWEYSKYRVQASTLFIYLERWYWELQV